MDSRLVLVTGGCRSGKSNFAQRYVEEREGGFKTYIATCPVLDSEMAARIDRHRQDRAGRNWITVEEQTDLANAVGAATGAAVLIDCLTLWVSNLMYRAEQAGGAIDEDMVASLAGNVATVCKARPAVTVVVTNEVGLGIVPDNSAARLFRDVAGRANQVFAGAADEVYLLVSGISVRIK